MISPSANDGVRVTTTEHIREREREMAAETEMEMEMRAATAIEMGKYVTPPIRPLSFSLHDSFLHSHCSSCFSPLPDPPLLPSPPPPPPHHNSLRFFYCSTLCSSADSPLHFSSSESHLPLSSDLHAALRLLCSSPLPLPRQLDRLSGLLTNHQKLMADPENAERIRLGARTMAAAAARRGRDGDGDGGCNGVDELEEAAALALCLVLTNAVEVEDERGRDIGIAVYGPSFSWINHSCSPNCCYGFLISPPDATPIPDNHSWRRIVPVPATTASSNGEKVANTDFGLTRKAAGAVCGGYGPRVIVRSIKRIERGEEVTITYTDLLRPKGLRQSDLLSKYRFICGCTRCAASPQSYVDHALQDISTSNIITSSSLSSDQNFDMDDANEKLIDYFDEVITEYLSDGDPKSCCKKLESLLILGLLDQLETEGGKQQLNYIYRLHPLHHLALNAYTTLASAYRVRASDLLNLCSDVDQHRHRLEAFEMSRISSGYSLLLAATTNHLFCSEPSVIVSAATFCVSAGESLVTLARSSTWGLPVINLASLAMHKCCKCKLLDRIESSLFVSEGGRAEFESTSSEILSCMTGFSQKVWSFLSHGCPYLNMCKDPVDFSWAGKSSDEWAFIGSYLVSSRVDFDCSNEGLSKLQAQECTGPTRTHIFQLGVHCLLYGGFLATICYGEDSHRTSKKIRDILC